MLEVDNHGYNKKEVFKTSFLFEERFLNLTNDYLKKLNNTSEILEKEERKCFLWQKLLKTKDELLNYQ